MDTIDCNCHTHTPCTCEGYDSSHATSCPRYGHDKEPHWSDLAGGLLAALGLNETRNGSVPAEIHEAAKRLNLAVIAHRNLRP